MKLIHTSALVFVSSFAVTSSLAPGSAFAQVTVGPSDVTISEPFLADGPNHYGPEVGYNGGDFVVVWSDNRNGCPLNDCDRNSWEYEWDVFSSHVGENGGIRRGPGGIGVDTESQEMPAIARGEGDRFLSVWRDGRSGEFEIRGAILGAGGALLGGDTRISPTDSAAGCLWGFGCQPAVAWNGEYFLIVWLGSEGLLAVRARPVGFGIDVIDIEPIVLAAGGGNAYPRVVAGGTDFLVVWEDHSNGPKHISGKRVSQQGVVLDADPLPISQGFPGGYRPAVAWDGNSYLVVFGAGGIQIVHVELDGTIPVAGRATVRGGAGGEPDVVSLDPGFLVVWSEARPDDPMDNGWGWFGIYGMRIGADGELLDPGSFTISNDTAYSQERPRIAGGDGRFLVAWQHSEYIPLEWTPMGVHGAILDIPVSDDPPDDNDDPPDDGDDPSDEGAGGCSTSGGNEGGVLLLMFALVFAVLRRRSR